MIILPLRLEKSIIIFIGLKQLHRFNVIQVVRKKKKRQKGKRLVFQYIKSSLLS